MFLSAKSIFGYCEGSQPQSLHTLESEWMSSKSDKFWHQKSKYHMLDDGRVSVS